MSFATKLGQFTEGLAQGAPAGLNLGLSIGAAGRSNDANQRAENAATEGARARVLAEAMQLADSGDPQGAADFARGKGYPDIAERMLARPAARRSVRGDAAAASLGTVVGGAAGVGQGADLTTQAGVSGAIGDIGAAQQQIGAGEGAVNALAGTPSPVPSIDPGTGVAGITETAPLGASPTQADALLGASLQQGQLSARKAGLTPFLQSLQGLEAFAGPNGRASQYTNMENQLQEIGLDAAGIQATMRPIKKAQQTLRDTGFLTLMQSGASGAALRAFLVDHDLSPGMQDMSEALISGVEFAEGQQTTLAQKNSINFGTSLLQQLKFVKSPEAAEVGYSQVAAAFTEVYGAERANRIVDTAKIVRGEVQTEDMRTVSERITNLGMRDNDDGGNRLGYLAALRGVPGASSSKRPSVEQVGELIRLEQVSAGNIPDVSAGQATDQEIKVEAASIDQLLRGTEIERSRAMAKYNQEAISESERNRLSTALTTMGWQFNPSTLEFNLTTDVVTAGNVLSQPTDTFLPKAGGGPDVTKLPATSAALPFLPGAK